MKGLVPILVLDGISFPHETKLVKGHDGIMFFGNHRGTHLIELISDLALKHQRSLQLTRRVEVNLTDRLGSRVGSKLDQAHTLVATPIHDASSVGFPVAPDTLDRSRVAFSR